MRYLLASILTAAAVATLAGCSDDTPATTPPPATSSSAATGGTTVTIPGTPTAVPSMELAGKWYPIPVAQCMQKVWDDRVDEWNRLTQARDAKGAEHVVVAGRTYETSEEWMKARGWPTSFAATMKAPATIRGCASAR